MIRRIGNRPHDFGKNTIEDMARTVSEYGFDIIQLALKKVLENVSDTNDVICDIHAASTRKILKKYNIDISVFGCYLNYGQEDEKARLYNVDRFLKHIQYANQYGARMVGTETGSLNSDYSYNKDNGGEKAYSIFCDSVEKMVTYAEEKKVRVALEAVSNHIINSSQKMLRIIKDMATENLVVIFDPVNLITTENYLDHDRIINEAFDLLEDKILAVHAKDFIIEDDKVKVVAAGKGLLNYRLFMQKVKQSPQNIDILLENIRPHDMIGSKQFLINTIVDI